MSRVLPVFDAGIDCLYLMNYFRSIPAASLRDWNSMRLLSDCRYVGASFVSLKLAVNLFSGALGSCNCTYAWFGAKFAGNYPLIVPFFT